MEYAATWGAYLLAVLGVLLFWWRVTLFIPWVTIRNALRLIVVAPLLVPAPVTDGGLDWAPALFVLLFDITLQEEGNPLRAVPFLSYGAVVALLLFLADMGYRFWRSKREQNRKTQPVAEDDGTPDPV